jgi:DNA-binding NarL/FixJ family response regulator
MATGGHNVRIRSRVLLRCWGAGVVALVAKELTNREVADELYVGDKIVEYHVRNVFGKLGVTSRRQLRLPRTS